MRGDDQEIADAMEVIEGKHPAGFGLRVEAVVHLDVTPPLCVEKEHAGLKFLA